MTRKKQRCTVDNTSIDQPWVPVVAAMEDTNREAPSQPQRKGSSIAAEHLKARRKKEMERKTYDGTFLTSMTYFEFLTSHVFGQFWRDISPILFLHGVTLLSVFGPVVNLCCKVLPQSKRIQTDGQKYCKHLNIYCEASGHESHARKGN